MSTKKNKTPTQQYSLRESKLPTTGQSVDSILNEYISWHLGIIDFEGPWGFANTFYHNECEVLEDKLTDAIDEDIPEDEFNMILNIVGQKFKTIDDLIASLHDNLPVKHVKKVLSNIAKENFFLEIHPRLKEFEQKTWGTILKKEGKRNHEIEISKVCRQAQNRLSTLKHTDIEKLVSLRITKKQRLWGIRNGRIFQVLWWDPEHTVYPVDRTNNKN